MKIYKFGEDEVLIRDDKVLLSLGDNTYVLVVEHVTDGDSYLDIMQFSSSGEKLQSIYMNAKPRRTNGT